jgi:1-acyl-sn-glycerol-3-phosphate acyltransferase
MNKPGGKMADSLYPIAYPRRTVQRGLARLAGRALLPLLTRAEIRGREQFPAEGPLLVVGNHVAAMEVVLMVAYTPQPLELLGPRDLPPRGAIGVLARFYGYIGVLRGQPDRVALTSALGVLRQGGAVGLFPEGGVWETGPREAKRGVAWLSQQAQAPVLPIGFGGLKGALDDMLRLKRPRLSMNVGELLPPVRCPRGRGRKACLQAAATEILDAVMELVPESERPDRVEPLNERFEFVVGLWDERGEAMAAPEGLGLTQSAALCRFFYRPALLNILHKDVHLPVEPLKELSDVRDPASLAGALGAILGYLEENPFFLTYRFGRAEGQAMGEGLCELHALTSWAAGAGASVRVRATRRYCLPGREDEIVETDAGETYAW